MIVWNPSLRSLKNERSRLMSVNPLLKSLSSSWYGKSPVIPLSSPGSCSSLAVLGMVNLLRVLVPNSPCCSSLAVLGMVNQKYRRMQSRPRCSSLAVLGMVNRAEYAPYMSDGCSSLAVLGMVNREA